jgi:hypothetical protein
LCPDLLGRVRRSFANRAKRLPFEIGRWKYRRNRGTRGEPC